MGSTGNAFRRDSGAAAKEMGEFWVYWNYMSFPYLDAVRKANKNTVVLSPVRPSCHPHQCGHFTLTNIRCHSLKVLVVVVFYQMMLTQSGGGGGGGILPNDAPFGTGPPK